MKSARRVLAFLFVSTLAACAGTDEADLDRDVASVVDDEPLAPEVDDAVSRVPWQVLGTGVAYKQVSEGNNVLLVYGGYTALDEWTQRWTSELYRAKGEELAIGHLYAIKGPNQSGYANREIHNSKLVAHLAARGIAANADALVVVAHSSGTFVSKELTDMLKAGAGGVPADTLSKVELFNLDGGGGYSADVLRTVASARWVYACDRTISRCSHNAQAMKNIGQSWTSIGGSYEVIANGSGCNRSTTGGLWCLHDAVITTRPHNPNMYDLKRDYTSFEGRSVVTSYLDVLSQPPPAVAQQ